MKKSSAIVLALGLLGLGISLGIFIMAGFSKMSNKSRTVMVRGLSEMEVEANKVTWPVVFKVIGNDLQDIYRQIENGNRTIVDYLTQNGLSESDFAVAAPDVIDKMAERYSNETVQTRYMATAGIIVTTNKVAQVRSMMQKQGELMKKGVAIIMGDYQYVTIYEYTDLNSVKPEMIADATRKAREAAEKFAEDSGSRVGKIMTANQGQFSIEDRDSFTPYIKKIRVVTTMTYSIVD
ncbi:MAG: SIMPL domain-containing protein [Bacteroidales bacterium]|nr:SIMPL domain-containing protein [Bacteroidales bacterium]